MSEQQLSFEPETEKPYPSCTSPQTSLTPLTFKPTLLGILNKDWVGISPSQPTTKTSRKLKLLTYNIWFDAGHSLPRHKALFSLLQKTDADIILLQEVTDSFLDRLAQNAFVQKTYTITDVNGSSFAKGCWYGVIALVHKERVGVEKCTMIKMPTRQGRQLLLVELYGNGGVMYIATSHFESLEQFKDVRVGQIRFALKLLKELSEAAHGAPAILCGDFNLYDEEEDGVPTETGFKDAWVESHTEEDKGYTFGGKLTIPSRWPMRRLDRVIYCGGVMVEKSWVVGGDRIDGEGVGNGKEVFISDHLGVVVEFEMRNTNAR